MFFALRSVKSDAMYKVLSLFFGAACLLAGGCGDRRKEPAKSSVLAVETVEVRLDSLPQRVEFVGYLTGNVNAVIQPRVNGYVLKVGFVNGMPVKRGDLLFLLDGDLLQTTQLSAEAELESARARELEARNNYERAVPLARIEAISQTQLDQYTTQYAAARAAVRTSEQTLRSARLEVGYTRILSPIDGIVAATSVHEGDYVGPGTQFEVLTTVSDLDTLSVALSIPMAQYLSLGGDTGPLFDNAAFLTDIRLYLADGSLYPYAGSYYYTHKDVASTQGTLSISVNFPNPDQRLKAGQFARVRAHAGTPAPRIVVPQRCVSQAQGVNSVWVVRPDSVVEFRRVELGDTYDTLWCVDSGLRQGERVLATGLQKVRSGEKVAPNKR